MVDKLGGAVDLTDLTERVKEAAWRPRPTLETIGSVGIFHDFPHIWDILGPLRWCFYSIGMGLVGRS